MEEDGRKVQVGLAGARPLPRFFVWRAAKDLVVSVALIAVVVVLRRLVPRRSRSRRYARVTSPLRVFTMRVP